MSENHYDLMILGSGPAGITAALYGQRLGLKTIVSQGRIIKNMYMLMNLLSNRFDRSLTLVQKKLKFALNILTRINVQ